MKVLKIAAIVIGAVALAATGVGLAGGFSLAASFGAVAGAAGSLVGVSAGVAGAVLLGAIGIAIGTGLEAILPSAKQSQGGSQTKWKADPYAGLPYPMGRTLVSGNIVYRRGHGPNNQYETFVTILACVTAASIDTTFMNKTTVTFDGGGNANGTYRSQIYQRTQLGAYPETSALQSPVGSPPGWTDQHRLSGLPAALNTFVYDTKSKTPLTSEPQPGWIGHWAKVYDPRLDSTYPGGSGACRALDESTYVWSEDPHLHGLTWCLGRWQNGKRVIGIGAPISTIDVAAFVEGANLNRARNWTLGGQVVSRRDTLWNSLKAMLQAGGAQPVLVGGIISCVNRAPRVSLATINSGDIVGDCTFSGTQPRRARINTIIPMYRSEEHDWEIVSASAVQVASYVAQDGDERTKEVQYPLVQDVHQVAQLAAYDICDGREAGPGSVPLKPWWLNYRIGDCVTFAPEAGMVVKAIITGRSLDAQSGIVTYQLKTETDSKHPFALGLTGTPPPTASLSYGNDVSPPTPADWSIVGATLTDNGVSIPALSITGVCGNPSAEAVAFDFRPYTAGLSADDGWISLGIEPPTISHKEITGVTPETEYQASIRYRVRGVLSARLILGPINAGQMAVDYGVVTGPTRPADNATVGGTIGVDIKLPNQPLPVPPGLLLNSALKLTPAGQLQYEPILGEIVPIGALQLEDFGAATAASSAQLGRDLDRVAQAVQTALNEASRTRSVFTNAGFVVDPATGDVTISAVQQTADTLSQVSIQLSAVEAAVTLRATRTYVDNAIAVAVLDPSQVPIFSALEVRISSAELTINALTSSVGSKASSIIVDALGARVTSAESDIDALDGLISTKVDSTEFDHLGARVSSAEQTLSALGDSAAISSAISVSRSLVRDTDAAAQSALGALLIGDLTNQASIAAIAQARQELTAKINDDLSAEAQARVALAVRVGAGEAQAVSETRARVDAIGVLVTQITTLSAELDDTAASVRSEAAARAGADGTLTAGLADTIALSRTMGGNTAAAAESALSALLSGDATKRATGDAFAAAREELTAKINGDVDVVVQRVTALLARVGLAEASLVAEQAVRSAGDSALAQSIISLTAAVGDNAADIRSANVARVDGDQALADRLDTMSARVGDAEAATRQETQARSDGDTVLAGELDQLSVRVGGTESAVDVERQARSDGDTAISLTIEHLTSRVGDAEAATQSEREARTTQDGALAGAIDALTADVGGVSADLRTERQARIDAVGSIAATVETLETRVGTTAADLSTERQARIDAQGALSASVETVSATVAGHSAQLVQQSVALVDLEGRTTVSFNIAATDADGTTYIEIIRQGGTGRILLGGDVITPGTITAKEIEANGITRTFSAENDNSISLSDQMAEIVTLPITMTRPGTIMVNAVHQLVFASGGAWETELAVEDTILMTESGNVDHKSILIGSFYAPAPGNYVVHLRARQTAGAVSINAGGSVMLAHRTYA
jgi:hypothetical protein